MKVNASTISLKDVFPLLGVDEDGVAVSRKGAMTIGWKMTLPVLYTKSEEDYDGMIHALDSAIRILPSWCIVLRQDIYLFREWEPDEDAPHGFFADAYNEHFRGRKYLNHEGYLFLTMSSFGSMMKSSRGSGLFGIKTTPSIPSKSDFSTFLNKASEFEAVLSSGSGVTLTRLTKTDWTGTDEVPGIVHRYMYFGESTGQLSDFELTKESIACFHKKAQVFNIFSSEKLPPAVSSVRRNELLSLENNDVLQSLGSALGTSLGCEHVVNTVFFVPDQEREKARLIDEQKKMKAGSDDDENAISAQEIQRYKEKIVNESPFTVKANISVIAWDDEERFNELTSIVSSAFSSLGITGSYTKYNAPIVWYAGIPGNATEYGTENMMTMELSSALCFNNWDTFQRSMKGGMLRICDRARHVPIVIDTQRVAREKGYIFDFNAFVLGPSGTGKSFFMNEYLRNCYDAGESVFIIDVGDSYEGLCQVIAEETDGRDGQYMTWDTERPLEFNPFLGYEEWLDENGNIRADASGANFFISVIETIWSPERGWTSDSEPILKQTVTDFIRDVVPGIEAKGRRPVFDDYYEFLKKTVEPKIERSEYEVLGNKVRHDELPLGKMLKALVAYSRKGVYGFLLNSPAPKDLFASRFIVFEVSQLSQVKDSKFYSLCILCIMNSFDLKMRQKPEEFDIMVIEEAWKAIANETMAPYLRELWKTARKYNTSAVVVTQSMTDIVSSEIIKDAILENSSTKILLDQSNNRNVFAPIAEALSLNRGDIMKIFSMNLNRDPRYRYRDVKLGEGFSGVFSTEVAPEEALAFRSEKDLKAPMLRRAKELGSLREAIREIRRKETAKTDS